MEYKTKEIIIIVDRKTNQMEDNFLIGIAHLLDSVLVCGQTNKASILMAELQEKLRKDYEEMKKLRSDTKG